MALIFERIHTDGIAELSYLIGDDNVRTAAVIDPRPDVDIYLQAARKWNVSITHVFETHIHADLVSGARELAARTQTAEVHASVEGGAKYGFKVEPVRDGDHYEFGDTLLIARHTPGHTPEHMSYAVAEKAHSDSPWGVFTGDSLLVSSAGRPDLLGLEADKLAGQLYDTFFNVFGQMEPGVIIFPAHGHGSPCGAEIGDRLESTIGYEKHFNPYFKMTDRNGFVELALSTVPPEPAYYQRMKRLNAAGPAVIGGLPLAPGLTPNQFKEAVQNGEAQLVDTRTMLAFGGGHIQGALNIGGSPMLSIWAGWLLNSEKPVLLVLEDDQELERVLPLFVRTGYTRFGGYLVGGMTAWYNAGFALEEIPQMTVHEVQTCSEGLQVLDVRTPKEWESGHIPCARHIFLPELPKKADVLDKSKPVITYCDSGYRASIAASLLQRHGFKDVRTMPGSWRAWQAADYPVEK